MGLVPSHPLPLPSLLQPSCATGLFTNILAFCYCELNLLTCSLVGAAILRGDIGEDDTVVVEAPGGSQAQGLSVYRKGDNGAIVDVRPNPVELTP